eukprot:CAMPEP_0197852864 /NCGR_PEP_ID=MMETSP1438-20131217/21574_1 /TAXON_ID=1461541 /ORGANISM="Pterosperma sp., Strain CCMP1384" /LENGTH=212 /DNA_ID=CAMNT_0043467069 /DNA_START=713 /DNA_END=1348 /DNA_ORIENTATION=+
MRSLPFNRRYRSLVHLAAGTSRGRADRGGKKRRSYLRKVFGKAEPPPPEEDLLDKLWNPLDLAISDKEMLFFKEVEQTHGRVAMAASVFLLVLKDFNKSFNLTTVFEKDLVEDAIEATEQTLEKVSVPVLRTAQAASSDSAHVFLGFWIFLFVLAVVIQYVDEMRRRKAEERTMRMRRGRGGLQAVLRRNERAAAPSQSSFSSIVGNSIGSE